MLSRILISQLKINCRSPKGIVRVNLPQLKFFSDETKNKSESKKKGQGVNHEEDSDDISPEDSEEINIVMQVSNEIKKRNDLFSPEEQAEMNRIGREYNRQSFIRENNMRTEGALKIQLIQDANANLPERLKAHALSLDSSPIPDDRPYPMWDTPPIKGFNASDYMKFDED